MSITTVTIERVGVFDRDPLARFWLRFGIIMAVGQADMLAAVLSNPAAEGEAFRQVMGL